MKSGIKTVVAVAALAGLFSFKQNDQKLVSTKSQVDIFSHTDAEDINANNFASTATLSKETGDVIVSVTMQSFEFKKTLMQKHFNSDKFLDTKAFPKAKFKGKTTNLKDINFSKDGVYNANVTGEMTIKWNIYQLLNPIVVHARRHKKQHHNHLALHRSTLKNKQLSQLMHCLYKTFL